MSRVGVVVVAGGSGSRMGAEVPKQFLRVADREVLVWTLEALRGALPDAEVVVVLPEDQHERWAQICRHYPLLSNHTVCSGGATRFHSVKQGLDALGECDIIAVHDGVRPLLTQEMVARCVATAEQCGTAIPVVEAVDSFRRITAEGSEVTDRSALRAVQTPQMFTADMLRAAYDVEFCEGFTDDASVVERAGVRVALCAGERSNIKITTPSDLVIAEALLAARARGEKV